MPKPKPKPIEYKVTKLRTLVPADYNPRVMSDEAAQRVCHNIKSQSINIAIYRNNRNPIIILCADFHSGPPIPLDK